MTVQEFVEQVRLRMGDLTPNLQGATTTYDYALELLTTSTREFYDLLPYHALPAKTITVLSEPQSGDPPSPPDTNNTNPPVLHSTGSGVNVWHLSLPTDYIRLIEFKCSGWEQSATVIPYGSDIQRMQYRDYLYGGTSNPKVTVININVPTVEFYTKYAINPITPTIEKCIYGYNAIVTDMPERLHEAYIWYIVSQVYNSMEEKGAAETALNKCLSIIKQW